MSSTQGDGEYLALLERYVRSDSAEPVETLSGWPEPRVRAAIRAYRKSLAVARPKAVVMLHTEAAFSNAEGVTPFQIEVARDFLPRPIDERTRTFAARWHGFVAQLYAFRNDEKRARLDIAFGFAIDSRSLDAALASCVVAERSIRIGDRSGRLAEASRCYRITLAEHPGFLEARLRLGRISY